jgi:hypothetical protein
MIIQSSLSDSIYSQLTLTFLQILIHHDWCCTQILAFLHRLLRRHRFGLHSCSALSFSEQK